MHRIADESRVLSGQLVGRGISGRFDVVCDSATLRQQRLVRFEVVETSSLCVGC